MHVDIIDNELSTNAKDMIFSIFPSEANAEISTAEVLSESDLLQQIISGEDHSFGIITISL